MPIKPHWANICGRCKEHLEQHEQDTKKCLFDAATFRPMTEEEYYAQLPEMMFDPASVEEDERNIEALMQLWHAAGEP